MISPSVLKGVIAIIKMNAPVRRAWATSTTTTCDVGGYCTEPLTHLVKYMAGHKPNKRVACDRHAKELAEAKDIQG
jgi:hypothetical protein